MGSTLHLFIDATNWPLSPAFSLFLLRLRIFVLLCSTATWPLSDVAEWLHIDCSSLPCFLYEYTYYSGKEHYVRLHSLPIEHRIFSIFIEMSERVGVSDVACVSICSKLISTNVLTTMFACGFEQPAARVEVVVVRR